MNTVELTTRIMALPEEERAKLIERLPANARAWIPESFREGTAAIDDNRVVAPDFAQLAASYKGMFNGPRNLSTRRGPTL